MQHGSLRNLIRSYSVENVKDYFLESLKIVWSQFKQTESNSEIGVPEWRLHKNVGNVYLAQKSVLSVNCKALLIRTDGNLIHLIFNT